MRDMDDKIIYALNTTLPTESFKAQSNGENQCRELYNQLKSSHSQRETAIKNCIITSAESLKTLKVARESQEFNTDIDKQFKSEQRRVIYKYLLL